MVHLTSFDLPPSLVDSQPGAADGEDAAALDTPTAVAAAYQTIIGAESATKHAELTQFLEQAKLHKDDSSNPSPGPLVLDIVPDKDCRRSIHQLFKTLTWAPPLYTEAVAVGDNTDLQGIQVSVNTAAGRQAGRVAGQKRKRQDRGEQWPGGKARYLRFALYKENFDTQYAVTTMSKILHLSHKVFNVAGTKDKRGVTVQWCTAYHVPPSKLARINAAVRGIRVGNFSYVDEQLRLGDLQGNKFEIVLRGLSAASAESVEEAAAALKTAGFINYYGLQRFGSSQVPTHIVGRALLRGEWDETIRHIMAPAESTRKEISEAIAAYLAGGSPEDALKVLPRNLVAERSILTVVAKQGRSAVVNALLAIPRNLRNMYLHAYQSYLWNVAASERVLRHGADKVIAGDLVISRSLLQAARLGKVGGGGTEQAKAPAQEGQGGAEVVDGGFLEEGAEEGAENVLSLEPHVVTAEEAASGLYRMEDVVLPVPGCKVQYPSNDIGDLYQDLMAKDKISMDLSTHKVKEFSQVSMPGTYRHVLCKPDDLQYTVLRYDTHDAELARTELEEMNGALPLSLPSEGKHLALRLAFSLPSSTYATMLIRELTKMPTSVDFARGLKHPE